MTASERKKNYGSVEKIHKILFENKFNRRIVLFLLVEELLEI